MQYRNIELLDIPSGMGGILPAARCGVETGEEIQVICLHPEYYTNWLLTVKKSECNPMTYRLDDKMKRIIDGRKVA